MKNAWSQFERTGAVQDYLDYVSQNTDGNAHSGVQSSAQSAVDAVETSGAHEGKEKGTNGTTDEANRNRTFFQ